MRSHSIVVLALLALHPAGAAFAGGAKVQEVAGAETLGKGELVGLALDGDGVVRPGLAFDATPLDVPTSWAAARSGDDLWIGAGNEPFLLRVAKDGAVSRVRAGDGLMVTAVAPLPSGGVVAAVFPGARLVRVSAAGDGVGASGARVETLATLPVEHVWALVPDGRGRILAATGAPGALFTVDPFGGVEKVASVDDDHARCLARRGDFWLVGTAPKGRLLEIGSGVSGAVVRVLRDLEPQEVVGVVPLPDGGVIVAANQDQTGGNPQTIGSLLKQMLEPAEARPGQATPARASLQDGRILHLEPSGVLTTLWEGKQVALLSLAPDGKGAVAGSYPSGRLLRAEPGRGAWVVADLPEAEASVVLGDAASGLQAVVTSNPAVLHRPKPGAPRGTFSTAPVDAGATARWGRITVNGSGVKTLEFRAGETSEPDATWSEWAPVSGFDGTSGVVAATTRFVQVRATLDGGSAELHALSLVAEAPNRAAVVTDLQWKKPGEAPQATAKREITWKAEDPDEDRLRVAVHAQRDGSPHWIEVSEAKTFEKPTVTWDTEGLPDGTYRIRLTVDDSPDNVSDRARSTVVLTAPLRIDNTAPRVTVTARVSGGKLLVEGEASDANGGRIAQVRVSVDGSPWQPVPPKDALYDASTERFEISLPSTPGPHDVVVQASDGDLNLGAAAVVVH